MEKYYVTSDTFDDVWPRYLTIDEYWQMVDDGCAVFTSEDEAWDFIKQ